MGVCKDPRLVYLNEFGYTVVRLPRTGIKVLGSCNPKQLPLRRKGTVGRK